MATIVSPSQPEYWRDRRLTWSRHAEVAAQERDIPVLLTLCPDTMRLSDTSDSPFGGSVYTFKVASREDSFHICLAASGSVVTVFRPQDNDPKHYDAMTSKRSRKGITHA